MFEAIVGDIASPKKSQIVVNPANGVGVMGRGVAGALADIGGPTISEEAKALVRKRGKPFEAGDVYSTTSGKLHRRGVQRIYHAVTMQYPGGFTSIDTVNRLMVKVLEKAIEAKWQSIAIPGLGTGIGRLDYTIVANVMANVAKRHDHEIHIRIIDSSPIFISEVNKLLGIAK